jgi:hypothetical protein
MDPNRDRRTPNSSSDAGPPAPEPPPTALAAPTSPAPPAAPSVEHAPLGLEEIDQGDLVLPRYAIVQPTSKEGTEGRFRSNLTGEEREELRFVPLLVRKGMVLWDKEDRTRATPLCRSNDAIRPDPAIVEPPSPVCHQKPGDRAGGRLQPICPKAKWNGAEPPACALTYNLVAIDLETGTPFLMSLSRTAARPTQRLISAAWMRRRNLFDLRVRARLCKVVDKANKYYVPEFFDFAENEPNAYRAWFEALRAYNPATTFESEEKAAQAGDDPTSFEPASF